MTLTRDDLDDEVVVDVEVDEEDDSGLDAEAAGDSDSVEAIDAADDGDVLLDHETDVGFDAAARPRHSSRM